MTGNYPPLFTAHGAEYICGRVPFFIERKMYMKKRIFAIAAIVILVGLYVACLVLALIHSDAAFKLLQLTLVMTVLVPVTAYVGMMFYKLNHRSDEYDEDK